MTVWKQPTKSYRIQTVSFIYLTGLKLHDSSDFLSHTRTHRVCARLPNRRLAHLVRPKLHTHTKPYTAYTLPDNANFFSAGKKTSGMNVFLPLSSCNTTFQHVIYEFLYKTLNYSFAHKIIVTPRINKTRYSVGFYLIRTRSNSFGAFVSTSYVTHRLP